MAEPEPGSFWQKQTNAAAAAIMAVLPFSEADTRAYGKFIHFSEETIVKSTVIYSLAEREKKWKKSIKKHLCNGIGSYNHVMIFENI